MKAMNDDDDDNDDNNDEDEDSNDDNRDAIFFKRSASLEVQTVRFVRVPSGSLSKTDVSIDDYPIFKTNINALFVR